MARKHAQEERKDRYFALHHYMLETDAWRALSAPARAVYIQIGFRYDGFNNGRIAFSVRDAASECGLANNTASKAFKELVALGFIEETRHGGLSRKTRIASEWRMTAFKCDLTGAFKSVLFMQRGELARGRGLLRSRPQTGRREPARLSQNVARAAGLAPAFARRRDSNAEVARLGIADGRVGEVFLDTPKASAIGEIAADAAIVASVAFQHGAPLETVRHALADRRAGPLGAALALIDAYQAQHKDSQQTGADF